MTAASFSYLGTPGFVRAPERFDHAGLLKAMGLNSGNLIFQHAATQIIAGPKVHFSWADTPYSKTELRAGAQAVIFPAANHLRLGADWTGLNNYLAGLDKPLVVFGLGAQSPKIGGTAETIAALKADAEVMRLVAILRDQAQFVSIRGAYTQEVCHALGLQDVTVLGCPSAMLHPSPTLGAKIAAQLSALQDGAPLRPAVTAAAPYEIHGDAPKRALEERLFDWAYRQDGLYVQQSGGVDAMMAAGGDWHLLPRPARNTIAAVIAPHRDPVETWAFLAARGRMYLSAPEWIRAMAGMDLAIGTRLHGNMAAIAAGRPGVIIAHDSRTGELAETMHLPRLTMDKAMAAQDLRRALRDVAFDGAAFDTWRARTAAQLKTALARIDIPVSDSITALAQSATAPDIPPA